MSEQIHDRIERLEFSSIQAGDLIKIATGTGEETWRYDFIVQNVNDLWPEGKLTATRPDGEEVGPVPFSLHGCGKWTTPEQNPVQTQSRAFTPYYDGLIVGLLLWGKSPASGERIIFDKPGQEISEIIVRRS